MPGSLENITADKTASFKHPNSKPVTSVRILKGSLYLCLISLCLFSLGDIGEAHADSQLIGVDVRTIEASHLKDGAASKGRVFDSLSADLEPQLSRLQFTTFKTLSDEKRFLGLKQREKMELPQGLSLSVRPTYLTADKVGLRLKWFDEQGDSLLDTLVHLKYGENVIVGTECEGGHSVILAVRASPEITRAAGVKNLAPQ